MTVVATLKGEPQTVERLYDNGGTLSVPVAELSAITLVTKQNSAKTETEKVAVLLGDGGRMYQAAVQYNQSVSLEFSSGIELEKPNDFTHVDAESIAAICSSDSRNGRFCELNENTTYYVGVEKGKNSSAGIFEYSIDGKLLSTSPIPNQNAMLEILGVNSENQHNNRGFEALTVSPDQSKLIFTTEGNVKSDDVSIRRLVIYSREEQVASLYKYSVHQATAGVSDILALDDLNGELVVIERYYDNTTKSDHIELYYFSLLDCNPQFSGCVHVDLANVPTNRSILAESVSEEFGMIPSVESAEVFSFRNYSAYTDNYEGICALDDSGVLGRPNTVILVSDDNEDPSQKTFVTTLELAYPPAQHFDPGSEGLPDYDYSQFLFFVLISLLIMVLLAFSYCRSKMVVEAKHDRLHNDDAQPIGIELSETEESRLQNQHSDRQDLSLI